MALFFCFFAHFFKQETIELVENVLNVFKLTEMVY